MRALQDGTVRRRTGVMGERQGGDASGDRHGANHHSVSQEGGQEEPEEPEESEEQVCEDTAGNVDRDDETGLLLSCSQLRDSCDRAVVAAKCPRTCGHCRESGEQRALREATDAALEQLRIEHQELLDQSGTDTESDTMEVRTHILRTDLCLLQAC
jgi:hypothetical protein